MDLEHLRETILEELAKVVDKQTDQEHLQIVTCSSVL